jgi:hypothetical protein
LTARPNGQSARNRPAPTAHEPGVPTRQGEMRHACTRALLTWRSERHPCAVGRTRIRVPCGAAAQPDPRLDRILLEERTAGSVRVSSRLSALSGHGRGGQGKMRNRDATARPAGTGQTGRSAPYPRTRARRSVKPSTHVYPGSNPGPATTKPHVRAGAGYLRARSKGTVWRTVDRVPAPPASFACGPVTCGYAIQNATRVPA